MNTYDHGDNTLDSDLRWTPILNGDIYCSPACGGKCKKAAYDKVVSDSNALASYLGDGWQPRIHENLGWYWRVVKGDVEVSPLYNECGYMAVIQFNLNQNYYFRADDSDARKAVSMVREKLKDVINSLERKLASSDLDPIELSM